LKAKKYATVLKYFCGKFIGALAGDFGEPFFDLAIER
jgi:hypothetical protein